MVYSAVARRDAAWAEGEPVIQSAAHKRKPHAEPSVAPALSSGARPFSLRRRQGAWRDALLRRMLALADLIAALAASASLALGADGMLGSVAWAALFAPAWLVIAKLVGLYDRDQRSLRHLTVDELPSILMWSLAGTTMTALVLTVGPATSMTAGAAIWMWLIASGVCVVLRASARFTWRAITPAERTFVIGDGALASAARRKLQLFPDMHVTVVGELDELTAESLDAEPSLRAVDRILVATARLDEALIAQLVSHCRRHQVKLSVVPPARGMFGTAVELNYVADLPVMEYSTWDVSRSTMLLKRLIDVGVSAAALVLLSPIMAVIALSILLSAGRPVFFVQTRAGQGGRPFRMLKFRTMIADAEAQLASLVSFEELEQPMFKLDPDPRVLPAGRFLRRTSLDELPQFINVLKGDMSLVGPRPEQVELVDRYTDNDRSRLAVKPGMTGPMQVYGRGRLAFDERLAVEREYVENISIGRDLRLLALTISPLFSGRGAS
jgi:exopolysaccharide biosynthesis polyprenyl glycosylphosphotransferase